MDLVGKVIVILPEVTMKNGKVKYGFVIETEGDYPQKIPFDVWGEERWQKLDVKLGAKVSVSFEIRGSEWKERYFVSLAAWRVQVVDAGNNTNASSHAHHEAQEEPTAPKQEPKNEDTQSDLPF